MKRKLSTLLLFTIGLPTTLSASTGAEQAKIVVMAIASIVIIAIINLKKKKKP